MPDDTEQRDAIEAICKEEGLSIMVDAYNILIDRGEVTAEQILTWLTDPERTVFSDYEDFVVRGINDLGDAIRERR